MTAPLIPPPSDLPSASQLRRVGKRFVAGTATDDDQDALGRYLRAADQLQESIVGLLSRTMPNTFVEATRSLREFFDEPPASSFHVRGRAKSENTLIDKLRRLETFPLGAIRDVAGVRVVLDCNLIDQDQLVDVVRQLLMLALSADEPRLIDRRSEPISGYRAVHLEFQSGNLPVEVQVRTQLQHLWAEMFERMADVAGRGIRYGEPAPPEWTDWVDGAMQVGDQIRRIEEMDSIPHEAGIEMLRKTVPREAWEALDALTERRALLADVRQNLLILLQQLKDATDTQAVKREGAGP